jgi:hypothetical protein
MRVSGFSFIKNGSKLGYPFVESVRSVLPVVDEFVLAAGESDDDTMDQLRTLQRGEGAGKLRILEMRWNAAAGHAFVYAAQSMAALYNCTGDWALYIQGDEAVHEEDHANIRAALADADADRRVEGLVFDYIHFFATPGHVIQSPAWYRREVRIVRNKNLKVILPSDAQYFVKIARRRKMDYLACRRANARMFHYGWCRPEAAHVAKLQAAAGYYGEKVPTASDVRTYAKVDPTIVKPFVGTHPAVMREWVQRASSNTFAPDPNYTLSTREKRQRAKMVVERVLGVDLSIKHYRWV